jgi:hypothetical protein
VPGACQGDDLPRPYYVHDPRRTRTALQQQNGSHVTGQRTDSELSDLARHILAFEHDRTRHDRVKEAEIRVEFDMSPARYYQVLGRVIDSPAALAYDPQLVGRLQRLRRTRVEARAARMSGSAGRDPKDQ